MLYGILTILKKYFQELNEMNTVRIILLIFFNINFLLIAQDTIPKDCVNLVPNASFEGNGKSTLKPWKKINTADYFVNSKNKKMQDVNKIKFDKNYILRPARTGNAYAGLRLWPQNYNEFLQVRLNNTLERGKIYYFEVYITPSKYANSYARSFGASFYPNAPNYISPKILDTYRPQIEVRDDKGLYDKNNPEEWIKITGTYTAQGNELFLTIGNFDLSDKEKFIRKSIFSFGKREAYYYVDDVLLCEIGIDSALYYSNKVDSTHIDSSTTLSDQINIDDYKELFKTPTRQDTLAEMLPDTGGSKTFFIYFEPNSYQIYDSTFQYLSYIIQVLYEHPNLKIVLKGYQDSNEGTADLSLAQQRALNIFHQLNGNGIAQTRFTIQVPKSSCKSDFSFLPHCRLVTITIINE
ncbi:MAG: OmpA family protein [Bacteroidales bacterium]